MLQNIEYIQAFAKDLISVESSASMLEVYTIMYSQGISYVPIIDHSGKVNIGVYTRKTLFEWFVNNQGSRIDEMPEGFFKEDALPEAEIETSLEETMRKLNSKKAILVKINGKYSKLITPRVVANALEGYATRFMVFEELERVFRKRILDNNIILDEIVIPKLNKGLPSEPEMLEFGQYVTVLSRKWDELGLGNLHKQTAINLLNSALIYRNALMHFRLIDDAKGLEDAKTLTKIFIKSES